MPLRLASHPAFSILAAAFLVLSSAFPALGQTTVGPFTYTSTNKSGVLQGQATIGGEPAAQGDVAAAFDEEGNTAGAAELVINQDTAYINLTIYGDDATTGETDEGINAGEPFTLKLYDASEDAIIEHDSLFSGWQNTNGAPMSTYDNPSVTYNFVPNQPPVASDDEATVNQGSSVEIDVLSNDSDPDGSLAPSTVTITTASENGSVYVSANAGTITYTSDAAYTGSDSLAYTVEDNEGAASNEATVVITVEEDPPAAPTGLTAKAGDGVVTLSWAANAEDDLDAYRLYRDAGPDPTTPFVEVGTASESYTDTSVTNGMTYYYRLIAVDSVGNENGYSDGVSATPEDTTAPAPPSELSARVMETDNTVDLTWKRSPSEDVQSYLLYRDTTASPTTPIKTIPGHPATIDSVVSASTTYYYRLTAVDSAGNESDYSNEASVTTLDFAPPDPPSGLSAKAEDDRADLSWAPNEEADLARYRVYRGTEKGASALVDSVSATSYTDDGLEPHTTYYYRLTAVDTLGAESDFSEEVSVATKTDVEQPSSAPETVELHAAYPNPVSEATTIRFGLPKAGPVSIILYDAQGREVAALVDGPSAAGWHEVVLRGPSLPSGTYFYQLRTSGKASTRKLVIVK